MAARRPLARHDRRVARRGAGLEAIIAGMLATLEASRYLNMDLLKEHKKEVLRMAA